MNPLFTPPDSSQILLLKAALVEGPAAEEAFAAWRKETDLFRLDPWSNGFMSLLYANLGDERLPGEVSEVLKGNYRYHWTRNGLWQHSATELLKMLRQKGIRPVVADDFRLAWEDYPEAAQRPLESLCLLLLESDVKTVLSLLEATGWTLAYPVETARHDSCTLSRQGDFLLRLEWRACFGDAPTKMEQDFRSRILPFSFGGMNLFQLHPLDQFFRIILRPRSPLRWIADLRMLTRHEKWNWQELPPSAQAHERCLSSACALKVMAKVLPAFPPPGILLQLRPSFLEQVEQLFYRRARKPVLIFRHARSPESLSGTVRNRWLRMLFFSVFLAWEKVRRKVPGWMRQIVKKTTARLNFTAPWLPRRS